MERLLGLKKLKPAAEKLIDIWLQEQVKDIFFSDIL
jgi:hypothetical protein